MKTFKEFVHEGLNESKFSSGMSLITNLTPEVNKQIEKLKKDFPSYKINVTSNDSWKPGRKDLQGTYTLSYSGPDDRDFDEAIKKIENK
jgi:hypothetical protein